MKKNSLFIIALALSICACSQKSKEDFIIGKWIIYKETNKSGDSISKDGVPYWVNRRHEMLNFKSKGILEYTWLDIENEPPQITDYEFVNDTLLRLNNVFWTFYKIDSDKFRVGSSSFQMSNNTNQTGTIIYWKRIE